MHTAPTNDRSERQEHDHREEAWDSCEKRHGRDPDAGARGYQRWEQIGRTWGRARG
jgi:hypothetical protein